MNFLSVQLLLEILILVVQIVGKTTLLTGREIAPLTSLAGYT